MFPTQSTLPGYYPSEAVEGFGHLAVVSPVLAAARAVRGTGCEGCGCGAFGSFGADPADPVPAALTSAQIVGGVVGLALVGFLSYQAGKAMTPGGSSKKKWGWIGVPVGLFTGPAGLGVMGWVSNSR
jgi:hypothetical protein